MDPNFFHFLGGDVPPLSPLFHVTAQMLTILKPFL